MAKPPEYPNFDSTIRPDAVESYLSSRNLLRSQERVVRLEPVAVPTRNATIRVVTSERVLVLKRFLSWPDNGVAAPPLDERFEAESLFHRAARISRCSTEPLPPLVHQDASEKCLVFEDAGPDEAFGGRLGVEEAESLAWFLVTVHHHSQSVPVCARHGSAGIRRWQSARLFPEALAGKPENLYGWRKRLFAEDGGVQSALDESRRTLELGGASLVHGDCVPSNWIRTPHGLCVVDAEFSFFGRPEFDAGAFVAGLMVTEQHPVVVDRAYRVLEKSCVGYDSRLVASFAATHFCAILDSSSGLAERRLGGVAAPMFERLVQSVRQGSLAPAVA